MSDETKKTDKVKLIRVKKTPEEKKAARRARAKTRRLNRRADTLNITTNEVLAQRKQVSVNATQKKTEKAQKKLERENA